MTVAADNLVVTLAAKDQSAVSQGEDSTFPSAAVKHVNAILGNSMDGVIAKPGKPGSYQSNTLRYSCRICSCSAAPTVMNYRRGFHHGIREVLERQLLQQKRKQALLSQLQSAFRRPMYLVTPKYPVRFHMINQQNRSQKPKLTHTSRDTWD